MDNSLSQLFSPLTKDYCIYFYYLSVFGFSFFIFTLIAIVGMMITRNKTWDSEFRMLLFSLGYFILLYFVFYFQNRLLYSMCVKTLV